MLTTLIFPLSLYPGGRRREENVIEGRLSPTVDISNFVILMRFLCDRNTLVAQRRRHSSRKKSIKFDSQRSVGRELFKESDLSCGKSQD